MVSIKTEVMKQTAVEWYQNAIFEILKEKENLSDEIFLQNILNAHLQAKEMEKEQITDAYWVSYKEGQYSGDKTADEYYNQTFKSESYQQKMRDKIDYYKNKFKSE
jgi:hypothetical protein